ncbi:MAG TPA: hypothetical protein VK206_07775 [Anaerolineales bacterium]|nr:hypothetical protein [Anaerolineales bacterium]HLO29706.1 hypothetical protein [Anaerolineales bacterium]
MQLLIVVSLFDRPTQSPTLIAAGTGTFSGRGESVNKRNANEGVSQSSLAKLLFLFLIFSIILPTILY